MSNVNKLLNKGFLDLKDHHIMRLWRERPLIFFRDVLNSEPDDWQKECIDLYMNNQRFAMVASKGPGKTWFLSGVGLHFLTTGYLPKMAAVSISEAHLKQNLWAELLKMISESPYLTKTLDGQANKIAVRGYEGWSFLQARSFPRDGDDKTLKGTLAGLHADYVAFLLDEGGSIPDSVISTAEAALSTGEGVRKKARLLIASNPERAEGTLYQAYKGELPGWEVYNISGDPDDPKRAPRVDIEWARGEIKKYGRDDPWVRVNVLGQFPEKSEDKLISSEEIDAAMNRTPPDIRNISAERRLGVDVARGGSDRSAIAFRQGKVLRSIEEHSSILTGPELAGIIMLKADKQHIERVSVDNTGGFGGSVIDSLGETNAPFALRKIHFNGKPSDKRYKNIRAEMWIRLRDWIRGGGCLPKDEDLKRQLLAPRIKFTENCYQLEDKKETKKRLGFSPDKADALALTFSDVEMTSIYNAIDDNIDNMHITPEQREFIMRQSGGGMHQSGTSNNPWDQANLERYATFR